jgi:hypothetical protein
LLERSHQGDPSDVTQDFWFLLCEFIGLDVHPPQPFCGRVMSTIQCGCASGPVEPNRVLKSFFVEGAKIFVPTGQLFLSFDLRTSWQLLHLTNGPAR